MGNAIVGEQGCGKSSMAANMMAQFVIDHPPDAIISMDRGGSFTDDFLNICASKKEWPEIRRRIRYIRLCDLTFCKPIPEFSEEHGVPFETQMKRTQTNFGKLMEESKSTSDILVKAAINSMLPYILRLLVSMRFIGNKLPWQITEAAALIDDPAKVNTLVARLGGALDEDTQRFFKERYTAMQGREKELRTYSLGTVFSSIGTDELAGSLGYYRPVITLKKVIEEGLILLVDGSLAASRPDVLNYEFSKIFSMVMEQVDLRQPHNPKNNKVIISMDEVVNVFKIPGMSEALSQLASLYRSRGLMFFIILQTLTQLDDEMRKGFWSLANIYCFGLLNKADAEEIAYQLLDYDPRHVKQEARTETQNNITEPLQGQDRSIADWLTHLKHRELIIRRRYSESKKDNFIRHVRRTQEVQMKLSWDELNKLKNQLMEEGGVPISEVKEVMSRRWDSLRPVTPTTRPTV
jgi:hypothetical protein